MPTRTYTFWLWLAIVIDASIVLIRLLPTGARIIAFLPHRSVVDWTKDLDLILFVVFICAGAVGIVWAARGKFLPLLFWNLCYLAILMPGLVRSIGTTTTFSPPLFFALRPWLASIAALSLYVARKQQALTTGGQERLYGERG